MLLTIFSSLLANFVDSEGFKEFRQDMPHIWSKPNPLQEVILLSCLLRGRNKLGGLWDTSLKVRGKKDWTDDNIQTEKLIKVNF